MMKKKMMEYFPSFQKEKGHYRTKNSLERKKEK